MIDTAGHDLVVIATDPQQMADSQNALINSVASKKTAAEQEVAEAKEIIEAANMAKIDDSAAKRLLKKAEHRLLYLTKVHAALFAGYLIMPNLPGDVVAIRVDRKCPEQGHKFNSSHAWPVQENPDALPAGEGNYVKPYPEYVRRENTDASGRVVSHDMIVREFDEEIGLPVEFLKPLVLKRTGEAMNLKVFDEILVVHNGAIGVTNAGKGSTRKGDPLVIGRIHDVGAGRQAFQRRRTLSFLVAWFVDTSTI